MKKVCPWWLGYYLIIPLRKFIHDPDEILRPHIATGMTAVDIGSGMGYFSIPMARFVGDTGKVVCVDLQERMLASLRRRAIKAGVLKRLELRKAESNSLRLEDRAGAADFVLAFAVVHEVPDPAHLFSEICSVLKSGGKLLVSEPKGHVTAQQFAQTSLIAEAHGFQIAGAAKIRGEHSAVFIKG